MALRKNVYELTQRRLENILQNLIIYMFHFQGERIVEYY